MIRNACESVKVVLRIIHANCFTILLTIFQCASYDTPFFQLFHLAVQVKLLKETAINSNMLTHDSFLFVLI